MGPAPVLHFYCVIHYKVRVIQRRQYQVTTVTLDTKYHSEIGCQVTHCYKGLGIYSVIWCQVPRCHRVPGVTLL